MFSRFRHPSSVVKKFTSIPSSFRRDRVDFFFPPFKRGIQLYRYYILCIGLKHIVSIDKTCFTLGYFFWRIVYLRNEPKKFIQIALVYMKWECHCEIYLIDYCKLSFHFWNYLPWCAGSVMRLNTGTGQNSTADLAATGIWVRDCGH